MSLLALKKYLPHILLALLGILLAWPAMAATTTAAPTAAQLSQELLCDTFDLISGRLGLMAGFLLAAWGIYIWIRQDAMKTALIYIICGALLTAVPGLVISTMKAVQVTLHQTGVSTKTYLPVPSCTGGPWSNTNGEKT